VTGTCKHPNTPPAALTAAAAAAAAGAVTLLLMLAAEGRIGLRSAAGGPGWRWYLVAREAA